MSAHRRIVLAVAVFIIAIVTSGSANPSVDRGGTLDLAWGTGGRPHAPVGVPGPIAAAGLPYLALAGAGYLWLRRRARRSKPINGAS